jgi:hypothetical protein
LVEKNKASREFRRVAMKVLKIAHNKSKTKMLWERFNAWLRGEGE